MFDLKSTAFFAVLSAVGVFWTQAKELFSRISSFFIVTAELSDIAEDAFLGYCWKNFKFSRFGNRKFTSYSTFIKPKSRRGYVAFEEAGRAITFFDGFKPIFISTPHSSDEGKIFKISFIRGTFDIKDLIANAVKEYDEQNHSATSKASRFHMEKFFGKRIKMGENSLKKGIDHDDSRRSPDFSKFHLNPLFWERSDIGSPTSSQPFQNLAYSDNIKELKTEIERWKKSEEWFKEKGLNWRFGAGLLGKPGCGKTSFIRATGQELDMPIHIYDLATMDNEELVEFWNQSLSAAPCIVLFEDIDRIFDKDKNLKSSNDKTVTLDCLLNCINGVEPANGILLFITANDVNKLDPALGVPDGEGKSSRPGRLDRMVYFNPPDEAARLAIATRILSDCPEFIEQTVKDGDGETGAQFEGRCGKLALEQFWSTVRKY